MRILLDTSALLELLSGSEKGRRVRELISESTTVYTTVLNLYELKYKLVQKRSTAAADSTIEVLKTDTTVLSVDEPAAMAASELKIRHPKLGAVDCNTWAVAQQHQLTLVTKDHDFPKSQDVILL